MGATSRIGRRTLALAVAIPIAAFFVVFGVSLLAFSLDDDPVGAPATKQKPTTDEPARALGEGILVTSLESQGMGFVTATIAMVPLDGSGSEPITSPPQGRGAYDAAPTLSPDDKTVAFWRVREPRQRGDADTRIYLVGVDGTGFRPLTKGPAVEIAPSWSGDGGRIVFSRMVVKHLALFVANADGSGLMQMTKPPKGVDDYDPSWAPDGERIVFTRAREDHGDLWITKPDRSPVSKPLLVGEHDDSTPAWSPDGQRIAFVRDGHIAVADGDGTNVRVITDDPTAKDWRPSWSGDGSRIVFSRDPGEVFVVDPDGKNLTQVEMEERAAGATWGPGS
jgi:Tol biopolymer transport system component